MNLNEIAKFDKYLSESCVEPKWVFMHPKIWNGYWGCKWRPIKLVRQIGRFLHSKYIYWLGFPIYWIMGVKDIYPELYNQYTDRLD